MNWIKKSYNKCVEYLSTHKKVALVLSHGGLHLLVLLILIIVALLLYHETYRNETVDVKHVKVDVSNYSNDTEELMCYFVGLMYGVIDLNNNIQEKDSFNINFTFFRADTLISEDYFDDYDYPFSISNALFSIDIKSNNSQLEKNSIYKNSINSYIIDKTQTRINYEKQIPLTNIGVDIPIQFNLNNNNANKKSPTSVLFLEINIDDEVAEEYEFSYVPKLHSIGNTYFAGSSLRIQLGNTELNNLDESNYKPFEIKYVYPVPETITPSYIEYRGGMSIQHILQNHGIYLIYEDVMARNKANRISLQYTVLIGAIIAFMLDIIVNLIIKWRKLSKISNRKNSHTKKLLRNKRSH